MDEQGTAFDRLGGEAGVKAIIDAFIDKVFDDVMIGFHFRGASRARVKLLEYQHAARFLGADVPYTGRRLAKAHGPHRILGGQFMRRLKILDDVLRAHGVPEPIRAAWIAHNESLRSLITSDAGSDCDHAQAEARAAAIEEGLLRGDEVTEF